MTVQALIQRPLATVSLPDEDDDESRKDTPLLRHLDQRRNHAFLAIAVRLDVCH